MEEGVGGDGGVGQTAEVSVMAAVLMGGVGWSGGEERGNK